MSIKGIRTHITRSLLNLMVNQHGIEWEDFRKKYMDFGGDGIYAASKLIHQEPAFKNNNIGYGKTPVAEGLQKSLMNFTTNQANCVMSAKYKLKLCIKH